MFEPANGADELISALKMVRSATCCAGSCTVIGTAWARVASVVSTMPTIHVPRLSKPPLAADEGSVNEKV